MVEVGVYVVALSFPIWALALWEIIARLRRRPKRVQRVPMLIDPFDDVNLAVLEAQFIVAPKLTIAELESQLLKYKHASSLADPFPADRASFEILQRLARTFVAREAEQSRRPQHR